LGIFGDVNHVTHISPSKEAASRFVDARFIAKKYKISPRYVLLMAAAGRIPSLRLGRKCVRFDQDAVARVLEGGEG
jgi:hypothetical protein